MSALIVSATIFKEDLPTGIFTGILNYVDDIITTIYRDISSTSTGELTLPTILVDRRAIFASCRMILYTTQDLS